METRRRRRAGKSTQAAASDPPVRPPSPASESEEESEAELADIRATGVRDRDPPTTTQPGDMHQTPQAGARAGIVCPGRGTAFPCQSGPRRVGYHQR